MILETEARSRGLIASVAVIGMSAMSTLGCGDALDSSGGQISPDSRWTVEFVRASFPDRKPNDTPWDGFGSAPDPQICITVHQSRRACSSVAQDTYVADWDEMTGSTYLYTTLDAVQIEVIDADVSLHDTAGEDTFFLQPSSTNGETFTFDFESGVSVRVRVEPE